MKPVSPRWVLTIAAAVLAALCGACVYWPPDRYSFYPACPFHAVTGLLCPGCGLTRALAELLRGDAAGAWHSNPLAFLVFPLALSIAGMQVWPVVRHNRWRPLHIPGWPTIAAGVLLPAFAVQRNIL